MMKNKPKIKVLTAREQSYFSYLEKYPVLATLMVLEDYEREEKYEECAIIKKVLDEREEYTSVSQYRNVHPFSIDKIKENNIARKKADLIKLKLPL